MSFQGRSPFNDVVRSVLLGAAMITPAALIACAGNPPPQDPTTTVNVPPPEATSPPDPTPVATATPTPVATNDPYATASSNENENANQNVPAPDSSVVRPRTPNGTNQMPTRGFSGAARARARNA